MKFPEYIHIQHNLVVEAVPARKLKREVLRLNVTVIWGMETILMNKHQ